MKTLKLIASLIVFQIFLGSILARFAPDFFFPQLGVVWVIFLADRAASSPARELEVWIHGLVLSAAVGYLTDLWLLAPAGLHMVLYSAAYVMQRVMTNRPTQQGPARLFITVAGASMLILLTLWWLKGFLIDFAAIVPIRPWDVLLYAVLNGGLALLVFPLFQRWFAESEPGFRRL